MDIEEHDEKNVIIKGVTVTHETSKALLLSIEEYDDDMWMPKSQIHEDSEVHGNGDEGAIVVSKWIAEQKELAW